MIRYSDINRFFASFAAFLIKRRRLVLIIVAALTVLGLAGFPKLRTQDNMSDWFDDAEQIERDTKRFTELFGNDDAVAVLVEAGGEDGVFAPDVLAMIDGLGDALLENVPYGKEIFSLTDFSISMGTEDGIEVRNPFEDGIPEDAAELREKRDFILSRQSLVNRLVSDDAKETWVILSLESYDDGNEAETMVEVGKAAERVVLDPRWHNEKWTLKATGMAYTEYEEDTVVARETMIRVIAGFIVVLICLIVFTRSLRGVIAPVAAMVGGIGAALGFEAHLGIPADANLMTLPVLLSMALSIGYAIHLINAFKREFKRTGKRKESVVEASRLSGWPVFFTALTTIASLVSFLLAGIAPLRWLGYTSALSVFVVYLYVVILVPVFYSFGKDKPPEQTAASEAAFSKTDFFFGKAGGVLIKKRLPVLVLSFIIIIAFIPGLFRITVNMDYFSVMGMKIPFIRRLSEIMETKIGSLYTYQVMVAYPEQDAFKSPENIRRLDDYVAALGRLSLTKVSGERPRVDSLTEIVKETYRALNGDDPAYYRVPDDPDLLAQILFLYEISGGDNLYNYVNEDFNTALLPVEIKYWDGDGITSDMADAEKIGRELFPGTYIAVIGTVAEFARMNDKIVRGELISFSFSFIIILILMAIVFRDLKTGLIGMIPNIAPVIILGGIMGYSGTPLDMLTMTIMPMVLGIAVDDTIHFISRVNYEMETGKDKRAAIVDTFRAVGKTLGMTTVILCAMFAVYTGSPIAMLFRMGVYSIVGLGTALAADYTMTPLLMYQIKKGGIRNEE